MVQLNRIDSDSRIGGVSRLHQANGPELQAEKAAKL